jgi:hypothetical protein
VPSSALRTTLKPLVSSSEIARQALVKFATIYDREITSALAEIWDEQLRDIPADLLQRACDRVAKTWTSGFMPTPANIRAAIDHTRENAELVAADLKWQQVLEYCRVYLCPDMPGGVTRGAPHILPRTMAGIRAAGGLVYIADCSLESLAWARKRFIEAYAMWDEIEHDKQLLLEGELKNLLCNAAQSKALLPPAPRPSFEELHARGFKYSEEVAAVGALRDQAVDEITEAVRKKLFGGPVRDRPEADLADELRRQKAALVERGWLASGQAGQNPARLSPVAKGNAASVESSEA